MFDSDLNKQRVEFTKIGSNRDSFKLYLYTLSSSSNQNKCGMEIWTCDFASPRLYLWPWGLGNRLLPLETKSQDQWPTTRCADCDTPHGPKNDLLLQRYVHTESYLNKEQRKQKFILAIQQPSTTHDLRCLEGMDRLCSSLDQSLSPE